MKKVTVIGHFAFGLKYSDGQTVKTKIVTEELCLRLGKDQVGKIDTHGGLKTLLKAPFQAFSALKSSKNVVIMPAHNGLKVNAPLLLLERRFFKGRKLHYVVIGGWLPEFLKKRKHLAKKLKSFDGIYVETSTMKKALDAQGFMNVFVMPNCKKLDILNELQLISGFSEPYRLCIFSRVMREKGIEDAVNAVKNVNGCLGKTAYYLDIYGPIDPEQTDWFENLKENFPEYIRYMGSADPDKSVEVLRDYFALLFPTRFYTEGIPGTIIDAYAAGLPVIAARWESCSDVIDEGKNGILYEFGNVKALEEILLRVAKAPEILSDMKPNCVRRASDFSPQSAIHVLAENL